MFYTQLLDEIRQEAQEHGLVLSNRIAYRLHAYIDELAQSCPEKLVEQNNWIEQDMITQVFKAYTTLSIYKNLPSIDMQGMWDNCTSHCALLGVILGINLSSFLYHTVCRDWGEFSLNPTEFQDTTVVSLIKQALLEKSDDT